MNNRIGTQKQVVYADNLVEGAIQGTERDFASLLWQGCQIAPAA